MSVALTLAVLLACVVVGSWARLNIGLLAIACAFPLGLAVADMSALEVAAGFPVQTFLTLLAVTLLFAQAADNGTLDALVARALRGTGGAPLRVALVCFGLAALAAAAGLGNIAATALLAPAAMLAAQRSGVPPLLMAVLVASGANAGAFSPLAPTGIIANELMRAQGLTGTAWLNFGNTLLAQLLVAAGALLLLGGRRLVATAPAAGGAAPAPLDARQRLTLAVLGLMLVAVIGFGVEVMFAAFVAVTVLGLARAADESRALQRLPWGAVLMVCGVMVLVGVLERSGTLDALIRQLAGVSDADSVAPLVGLVAALASVFSSSSGVVLPTLLPMARELADHTGGSVLGIAAAINVGAHLVDVSPLSTLGALCITAAPEGVDRAALFRGMLAWGLGMALVIVPVAWILY